MKKKFSTKGPIAIRMAKQSIDAGSQVSAFKMRAFFHIQNFSLSHKFKVDIASGLAYEELCYAQVIPTKDRIEGLNSFIEKRNANYVGE